MNENFYMVIIYFFPSIISIFFIVFKMVLNLHSGLSKDLSLILNDADDFNVIIQVGENQNIREFRAHSVILRARSPYFKSALSSEWITKMNNMIMFNKPNISPKVFDMILK
jgi:hypothetical protein